MQLVEIRDLDGPNLFLLRPAIKIELVIQPDEAVPAEPRRRSIAALGIEMPTAPTAALAAACARLHELAGLAAPEIGHRTLDQPDHIAIYYPWEWRSCALAIAEIAIQALSEGLVDDPQPELYAALERDQREQDVPQWVRDSERSMPAVGITGTNGKTTTTRLIAHIVRQAGMRAGWCSSTGVYIDGEQALDGDYTGPSGARRVLLDRSVDVAVLETARGGILLRGLGYESNDVGVMLNISGDHLSLQGVETLETLAAVKSVVVRVTRPEGLVVLNADDPLVLAQRAHVRASVLLTSQEPDCPAILNHLAAGGRAVVRSDGALVYLAGERCETVAALTDVPVTFGGIARHMVANALAATGAALGLGLSVEQVAAGLRSFRSDVRSNTGRLNVFRLDGRTIVVDYAHNESGLEALLDFTRRLIGPQARVAAVIGTAGDRQDEVFRNLGRIAACNADSTYLKANPKYLRGRPAGEGEVLMRAGVIDAGGEARLMGTFPSELLALRQALEDTAAGDAIAVMCVEDQLAVFRELRERGALEWS